MDEHLPPRARYGPPLPYRLGVTFGWTAWLLATTHWRSWQNLIQTFIATDTRSYEAMARAAPGLPDKGLPVEHAQRFATHFLIGAADDVTGLPLHTVYWITALAALGLLMLLVERTTSRVAADTPTYVVLMGAVLSSPYLLRYHLVAPGLLADIVFMIGLVVALDALLKRRPVIVLIGVLIAVLGRQTAVPVGLVAGAWMFWGPGWRTSRRRSRLLWAAAVAGGVVAAYGALILISDPFALPETEPLRDLTIWSKVSEFPGGLQTIGEQLGTIGLGAAPGLAVFLPLAVSSRRRPAPEVLWCLAAVAALLVQPLLLNYGAGNLRLSAFAIPILIVAAGLAAGRSGIGLNSRTAWAATALFALGSLNHKFTNVGPETPAAFAMTASIAFVGLLVVLCRGVERGASRSVGA